MSLEVLLRTQDYLSLYQYYRSLYTEYPHSDELLVNMAIAEYQHCKQLDPLNRVLKNHFRLSDSVGSPAVKSLRDPALHQSSALLLLIYNCLFILAIDCSDKHLMLDFLQVVQPMDEYSLAVHFIQHSHGLLVEPHHSKQVKSLACLIIWISSCIQLQLTDSFERIVLDAFDAISTYAKSLPRSSDSTALPDATRSVLSFLPRETIVDRNQYFCFRFFMMNASNSCLAIQKEASLLGKSPNHSVLMGKKNPHKNVLLFCCVTCGFKDIINIYKENMLQLSSISLKLPLLPQKVYIWLKSFLFAISNR